MADGNVIAEIKKIIDADKARKYIVVSAPGKRYSGDIKVTDLLYGCFKELQKDGQCKNKFSLVRSRFEDIARQLNLSLDMKAVLDETEKRILEERSADFIASRGEYLSARIAAEVLGAKFIDAEQVIFFNESGSLDGEKTNKAIQAALSGVERAVLPGFYGKGCDGKVKTFSRGGSDISGALVARAVNASLYENWTDVSGFLACDPRIVESPKRIKCLSYKELRELSYMGADVLHSESIFPVRKANIPIQIKNTFRPDDEGTTIVPTSRYVLSGNTVTGIAGKKNFTVIFIEKSLMNSEIGFVRKVLSVIEDLNLPVEHIPSGIDTMSLVISSDALDDVKLNAMLEGIKNSVEPDVIRVIDNIALINIKMLDQGASEINIVVGVKNDDYENCIKAIYAEFFG